MKHELGTRSIDNDSYTFSEWSSLGQSNPQFEQIQSNEIIAEGASPETEPSAKSIEQGPKSDEPQWDPRLTQVQIEELTAEGITPDTAEYGPALYNFGIKPTNERPKPDKLQWDPRLTTEQIDDLIQRDIYEPVGQEYEQALAEFGIRGNSEPINAEDIPNAPVAPDGPDGPNNGNGGEDDDDNGEDDDGDGGEEDNGNGGERDDDDGEEDDDDDSEEDNGDNGEKDDSDNEEENDEEEAIEQEINRDRRERLEQLGERLDALLPQLAELYARNRRLFVGSANRADFIRIKGEYGELLNEFLRLRARENYESGKNEVDERLATREDELVSEIQQKLTEFAGGDLENTDKTQEEIDAKRQELLEEADETLSREYGEMMDVLKTKVNADLVRDFLEEETRMEVATTDALDNGSICRKFVSKVLNNKALKGVLVAAAVVGLAVTGVGVVSGLVAGTMAFVPSFTAGGMAIGATKGGLMGTLMSRQDSKKSAVRGFATEEEIIQSLEGIDITEQDNDTANVADWLMKQYGRANNNDWYSNRKKTRISAGIGAAIGVIMSGIHINDSQTVTNTKQGIVDHNPDQVSATNLNNVNIPEGHGAYDTFTQLGGKPEDFNKFQEIMFKLDPKYGLAPGSNGEVAGVNGLVGNFAHTYPGTIDTWPSAAQSYITEVANEAAKQGLIPAIRVAGGPIYGPIPDIATNEIPNAFRDFLARAIAAAGIGAIGSMVRDGKVTYPKNRGTTQETRPTPTEPEAPEPVTPEDLDTDEIMGRVMFRNLANEQLGSLIGEDGVDIISENGQNIDRNFYSINTDNWWNGLDDATKDSIRAFERANADSEHGVIFRDWLISRGEI